MIPGDGSALSGESIYDDSQVALAQLDGTAKDFRVPDDQRPANLMDQRLGPGADDDLRPDAGGIALRDCNQRAGRASYHRIVFSAGRLAEGWAWGGCVRSRNFLYCTHPCPLAPGPSPCEPASNASPAPTVAVAGEVCGQIGAGMLVLLGVAEGDTEDDARWLAEKTSGLRIFDDGEGK